MIDKTCALLGLPPFAVKVISKLRRFEECASDGEGADIGREWFDILTQLGLLTRVQRSPGLWEMTKEGEDLLCAPVPSAGGEVLRYSESWDGIESDENGDYCHYTHVTRLQAAVASRDEKAEQLIASADRHHLQWVNACKERDALKLDLKLSEQEKQKLIDANESFGNIAFEKMALQSELTEVRELLEPLAAYAADSANAVMRARAVSARKLLAHQSAQASEVGE